MPALAVLLACGGAHAAGPSPVTDAPSPAVAAQATRASRLPATYDAGAIAALGLDPTFVRDIVYSSEPGGPTHPLARWSGPARHCVAPGLDPGAVAEAAAAVQAATGISWAIVTTDCGVRWANEPGPGCGGHACTGAGAADGAITAATIYVPRAEMLDGIALHELGHAIGLSGHSTDRSDAMAATDPPRAFSPRELAVLAAMFGR